MSIEGRVVLVAGSTGAVGRAVTRALLAAGAVVGAIHRGTPPDAHDRLVPLRADIATTDGVTHAVTELLATAGRIDALVNTVGGFASGRVAGTSDEEWRRMMSLNLDSAFMLSRGVLPHMTARHEGRIVHVASRAAEAPFAGAAGYLVAKSALLALVRVMAVELAGTGITVNAVLPGTIDTSDNRRDNPKADPSRWLPPDELARLILHLLSDDARHISGALIPIG